MSWDFIFPTREGSAVSGALERRMLNKVGGAETIRTEIQRLPDGSEVMLRTRNGFPEFTKTPAQPILVPAPTEYNFQGLPIAAAAQYGFTQGGVATSATVSTDLVWSVANASVAEAPSFSKKLFAYHGNAEWRDTRQTREFDQVVSWRGVAALSRNAPMAYPSELYPDGYSFMPFANYEAASDYYGVVWVDGVALPKIADNLQVLAAALHRVDAETVVVRAVTTRRITDSSVVGFGHHFPVTGMANTTTNGFRLFQIPIDGASWSFVGTIELKAVLWQAPVFDSSGASFAGLIRVLAVPTANVDIKKAVSKRFTCAFGAGSVPVISESYRRRNWIRRVKTTESNLTANYDVAQETIAVDYVGDTLHEATHYDWLTAVSGTVYKSPLDAGNIAVETILDITQFIRAQQDAHGLPHNYYSSTWTSYTLIINGVEDNSGSQISATVTSKSTSDSSTMYWLRVLTRVPGISNHTVSNRRRMTVVVSSNGLSHTVRDRQVLWSPTHTVYPPVSVSLGAFFPGPLVGGKFEIHIDGVPPYTIRGESVVTDEYNGRVTSIDLRSRSVATAKQTLTPSTTIDSPEVLPIVGNNHFIYGDAGPQNAGQPEYTPPVDASDLDVDVDDEYASDQPALAHQDGAPLYHASHPHLPLAVFTGPLIDGVKTTIVTAAGASIAVPNPADGECFVSPLFFRRYPV